MTSIRRICFSLGCLLVLACSDDSSNADEPMVPEGATETNVAPAPCNSNDDCPSGVACAKTSDDGPGHCDVQETEVNSGTPSLGAPAPCNSNDDCPSGVACAKTSDDGPGHCDVQETQAP